MRKLIQFKAQGQSVYIAIEKQSHIIMQMRHYTNGSLVSLWNYQQSWRFSHCEGCCSIQLGLLSRTHGHHTISNDRAAVKGVVCQPSAASGVDRRAAGDLQYRLGLDHYGYQPQIICCDSVLTWPSPANLGPPDTGSDMPPGRAPTEFFSSDALVSCVGVWPHVQCCCTRVCDAAAKRCGRIPERVCQ